MTQAKFSVIVYRRQTKEKHKQCYNRKLGEIYRSNPQTDYLMDPRPTDEYIKGLAIDVQ
tara:strand:- start:56 stop:232 length:177 start_codon:yes stop_codon:yes gene_type:complete